MKHLQVDRTTLADLELFSSTESGRGGIMELIDRTTTARGRVALRNRLQTPYSDIKTIRETQDAIRFLQAHPNAMLVREELMEKVGRYVNSNLMTGMNSSLGSRLELAWLRLRYKEIFKELASGVRSTLDLFTVVARNCDRLLAIEEPPRIVAELVNPLRKAALSVLAAGEPGEMLRSDRKLRADLREAIVSALQAIGELDALSSMALITTELGWAIPELHESDTFLLEAEGVYHPFLPRARKNPVRLNGGEPMVFLTGPNMAGKTTYLRSVALVVLLAQVGMGVPARRARLTPVDNLFTSLNPVDNLRAGLSYFLAEVMRVKEAATILANGERAFVLFDEVFKGTNVLDALDASGEVIQGFAKARRSGFIFSSHLSQLQDVLRKNPAIRFCYFDGEIVGGAPHYEYQLLDGVSDKRFGLLLLRQAQVTELLARI